MDPKIWTSTLVRYHAVQERGNTNAQAAQFRTSVQDPGGAGGADRDKSIAQVGREYDLKAQVVARWKTEFLERAPTVFAPERERSQDQARMAELERRVGRLTLELELAKKASQLWNSTVSRNGR